MKKITSAGNLALFFCIIVTSLWTFWGVTEMFHEGWYAPFEWMFFLLPASLSLTFALIALTWPRLGGWLLIGTGIASYAWMLVKAAINFGLNPQIILSWLPASGFLAFIGVLFLLEARRTSVTPSTAQRGRRSLRYLLAIGIPLLLGLGLASKQSIHLANRVDDGNYGTRLIPGNRVSLVWAPAGLGWGRSVTWNQVALYGLPPLGFDYKSFGHEGRCNRNTNEGCATARDMQHYNVCLYLSEDGSRLETSLQGYWRMPTTDEIVRSLVRHGENAGCIWEGQTGNQQCTVTPDKEAPLWNPNSPLIYLWSADEANRDEAYYVTYHGAVWAGSKFVGLGSRGYRCVRSPLYEPTTPAAVPFSESFALRSAVRLGRGHRIEFSQTSSQTSYTAQRQLVLNYPPCLPAFTSTWKPTIFCAIRALRPPVPAGRAPVLW